MAQKILIIDDDASLRRVLEYNLQEAGYEVLDAANGEDGLALFKEHLPPLVITAFGAVETAVEAMKLGAYDYITKPFNRDELRLVVQKAMEMQGLSEENRRLKEELAERAEFRSIVGISRAMERVFATVRKVADTEAAVLIAGESGTGKELVARAIHSLSSRRNSAFVAVNCAAIPRDLLESELFGHVRGAFTGAVRDKVGKFQLADGGTLFLDEVGELPLELQPKLLRALQEKSVERVGGTELQKLDVRVVAATNADLEEAIATGTFRDDLYYRLAVIPLHLPPLRERREDIPLLIRHFTAKHGGAAVTFAPEALALLQEYPWPGNVRELENTVERLLILRSGDTLGVDDLPDKIAGRKPAGKGGVVNLPPDGYSLEELEREVVLEALERNDWNQTKAARFLRIPRHTLIYRMEKYAITQEEKNK